MVLCSYDDDAATEDVNSSECRDALEACEHCSCMRGCVQITRALPSEL